MKTILMFVSLFLLAVQAQASPVTVDFAEVTPVSGIDNITIDSKGYRFSTFFVGGGDTDIGVNADGIYAYTSSGLFCSVCYAGISMVSISGDPFAIYAIEISGAYGDFSNGELWGQVEGGAYADLSAPVGTGDWLNLEYLELLAADPGELAYTVRMDDVVVGSAVPIPAAAWLFGSALAGLGWMRRQQTA